MAVKDAVLQALENARGARISGGALAASLGVSRAAVWKAIDALRAEGLSIDAVPGEGYRLASDDDSLTAAGISALLTTRAFGRELLVVPSLSSTNTVLKQDYLDKPHGFALLAEAQTGGRGRLGRSFASPAGTGLYISLLLHPSFALSQLQFVTIAAAVAVCEAIEQTAGFSPQIKWVNDVLRDGKKLCGILTEAIIEGETGAVGAAVVGIGINLRGNPEWPDEVRKVAGALSDFGTPPRRAALAAALLKTFEDAYALLEQGRADMLLEAYRSRLCCIGRPVTVTGPTGSYQAQCTGLDKSGHLLVQTGDGQTRTLSSGEISIRF
ncbi:biotin--[acetyl-CoA-carboxylase] ligase [Agathobaculum sp.]|uniref:biotin--[acetyl-CoA-carboxylase] ligase n=1 Tax=Agathobaculum sp. TaxID=2048138 RepID=UPI002A8036BE|nr:biotin--[acetyl-CoA-carboxylase] ligase [Agathobaculum sp.]MDY3617860.1 biotin--[acetyl-CoA-carboxylase] ligase [Agathobaculum sp.]